MNNSSHRLALVTVKQGVNLKRSFNRPVRGTADPRADRSVRRTVVYVLVSAAIVGYATRTRESFFLGCVMDVLVIVSLMLILDIDRPGMGGIREPQLPMLLLQRSLRAQSPAMYRRRVETTKRAGGFSRAGHAQRATAIPYREVHLP